MTVGLNSSIQDTYFCVGQACKCMWFRGPALVHQYFTYNGIILNYIKNYNHILLSFTFSYPLPLEISLKKDIQPQVHYSGKV